MVREKYCVLVANHSSRTIPPKTPYLTLQIMLNCPGTWESRSKMISDASENIFLFPEEIMAVLISRGNKEFLFP